MHWNGVSSLATLEEQETSAILTSDASESWGGGAYWESKGFQLAWHNTDYPSENRHRYQGSHSNCNSSSNEGQVLGGADSVLLL